jgi:rubrerythrin
VSQETKTPVEITTVEEFLAHALTLETEAAEGYQEIGDSMQVHNNPEVAELFFRFARYGRKHADEVRALAEGLTLPHIAPWEFVWEGGESPETPSMDKVHYLMTPAQALRLAMRAERHAHAFYASLAETSRSPRIRELAAEFATEEAEHVRLLTEWVKKYPDPDKDWDFDPDPPGMPE